jgi:hypothetical protein
MVIGFFYSDLSRGEQLGRDKTIAGGFCARGLLSQQADFQAQKQSGRSPPKVHCSKINSSTTTDFQLNTHLLHQYSSLALFNSLAI